MFYITTILISDLIIILANFLNSARTYNELLYYMISVCIGTIAIIAVDGLFALIIRRLTPLSWFSPSNRIFRVSKKEYQFFRKIKIKAWKDKVPELGGFTSFHKDKLVSTNDQNYLSRFLLESNYGVAIHAANAALGFLIAFIPFCSDDSVWIPIFIVNFVLSILPIFVLRFNNYTLLRLYERSLKINNIKNEKQRIF